jgi:hypothetical protein
LHLSFRYRHQNPVRTSPLPNKCHMPRPPNSPCLDIPHNISWAVQIRKLFTVQFLPFSCYLLLLRPDFYYYYCCYYYY